MKDKLSKLNSLLEEIMDLRGAGSVLAWDQETYMPPQAAISRAKQMATLEKIAHNKFTSDEVGTLLEDLDNDALGPFDSRERSLVRVVRREFERSVKLPESLVGEIVETEGISTNTWVKAKNTNDFALFRPHLEKLVDLARQKARILGYDDSPYDALLFAFEPGMKSKQVEKVFSQLKSRLIPFVKDIIANGRAVDNSFLFGRFPSEKQWKIAELLLRELGYDLERGRLDQSEHPFTMAVCRDDVRLTTHVYEHDLASSVFSVIHEYGHGMYEQGIPEELNRSPLGTGASSGIHESQSRMWENIVGRSREFWQYMLPKFQREFPSELGDVSLDQFYWAVNKVQPSLIRVDADEVTYNLHIFVRFELEKGLVEGKIEAADLPALWNAKMAEYLGIVPEDDKTGVLQDIHWAGGMFGYFPTYTLGNILSVQIYNRALQDLPDLAQRYRTGDFQSLADWLRQRVHIHGAMYTLSELLDRVIGQSLDANPYMDYIENKFRAIYL